jgi:AraC-like DNA-binding protein
MPPREVNPANPAQYGIAYQHTPIRDMLRDFHILTGIRVAYFPIAEYPATPDASTGGSKLHEPPVRCGPVYPEPIADFCAGIRQHPLLEERCLRCDRQAFVEAQATGAPILYRCHMGLLEAVAPILDGDRCLGYLMMGQILDRMPDGPSFEAIRRRVPKNIPIDPSWEKAFTKLNHLTEDKIQAAFRLLTRQAQLILTSEWVQSRSMPVLLRLETVIRQHPDVPLRTADLARLIGLSPSRLTHVVKEQTGRTVTQFFRSVRMHQAMDMLRRTCKAIQEIAQETGWQDPRYFARVFKQETGETPQAYRSRFVHPSADSSLSSPVVPRI